LAQRSRLSVHEILGRSGFEFSFFFPFFFRWAGCTYLLITLLQRYLSSFLFSALDCEGNGGAQFLSPRPLVFHFCRLLWCCDPPSAVPLPRFGSLFRNWFDLWTLSVSTSFCVELLFSFFGSAVPSSPSPIFSLPGIFFPPPDIFCVPLFKFLLVMRYCDDEFVCCSSPPPPYAWSLRWLALPMRSGCDFMRLFAPRVVRQHLTTGRCARPLLISLLPFLTSPSSFRQIRTTPPHISCVIFFLCFSFLFISSWLSPCEYASSS